MNLSDAQISEIVKKVTQEILASGEGCECGAGTDASYPPNTLGSYIDHTVLRANASIEDVRKFCDEAKKYHFASVCVNPSYVKFAAEQLEGSGVKPSCVIGFPLGAHTPEVKKFETQDAVRNGAKEVDMVINVGAVKSNDWRLVKRDIEAVVEGAKGKAAVKVILETCLLTDEEKVKVCTIAKVAGADFVKTSSGFSTGGATVEDLTLMRKTVGPDMRIKASTGIRTYEDAVTMIKAGADRLGTSAGIKIVTADQSGACTGCGACNATCPTGNCTITKSSY